MEAFALGTAQETISVALCTYNGQRFLPKQLSSIADQTRLPDELVVCDDQSTDQTVDILRSFRASAPFPVRIIHNKSNLGSAKNFEHAAGLCSGSLIALSDQDDLWHPSRLDRSESALIANPLAALVFSDGEIIDDEDQPAEQRLWQSFSFTQENRAKLLAGRYDLLLSHRFVTGATVMFRSHLRDRCFPVPAPFIHDEWMAAVLIAFGELLPVEAPLIRYRRHTSQQVGTPAGAATGGRIRDHWNTLADGEKSNRYWRQLANNVRFAQLVCRTLSGTTIEDRGRLVLDRYQRWLQFASVRLDLPAVRHRRLGPIIKNYSGYSTYAHGFTSALKDLVRSKPGT